MTNDQICEALAAVGAAAYVDVIYGGYVVLDGTFDLQQLVAIGDVARKALDQQGLSGELNEAVEQFGAERLATALVEPSVGARIRIIADSMFAKTGECGELTHCDSDGDWWFKNSVGRSVCLARNWFEVSR